MRWDVVGCGVGILAISQIVTMIIPLNVIPLILVRNYIGFFGLVGGIIIACVGLFIPKKTPLNTVTQQPPQLAREVVIKEVIHEVVKVKCQFCGTLVDHLASTCPNCSGVLK